MHNDGVQQHHDFPASHHFGGPWDNGGKTPKIMMAAMEAAESERVYNYHCCLEFCEKHMAEPSPKDKHAGTWGCNGDSVCMFMEQCMLCVGMCTCA